MLKGNSQHQLRPHQALCAGQHIVAQDICTRITKAQHKVLLPDLPLSLALAQGEAVLSQLKHRHLCRCPFASGEIRLAAMHKDVPSLLLFFFFCTHLQCYPRLHTFKQYHTEDAWHPVSDIFTWKTINTMLCPRTAAVLSWVYGRPKYYVEWMRPHGSKSTVLQCSCKPLPLLCRSWGYSPVAHAFGSEARA